MKQQIKLTDHIKQNKLLFMFMGIVLLCSSLLEYWVMPEWSRRLLETLVGEGTGGGSLRYVLTAMVLTAAVTGLLVLLNAWCNISVRKRVGIDMERAFVEKCCRLESLWQENSLSLLRQTLPQVCERESNWIAAFLKIVFGVFCASAFVITVNWRFLLLTYGAAAVFIILSWMRQKKVKKLSGEYEEKSNSMYAAVWEHIYNREITPFLDSEKTFMNFRKNREEFLQALLKLKKAGNLPQSIALLGSGSLMTVSLLFGGYLYLHGRMGIGDVYGITIIVPILANVLLQIPAQIADFQILKGAHRIIDEFMQLPEYKEKDRQEFAERIETIEVKLDSLGYPNHPEVLKKINFLIKRGEFAVITGASGSGKSTLIRNMAALEKGYTGQISVNGKALDEMNREDYWHYIDYLGQEPGVTDGSVRHNIILHKPFDENRYQKAITEAGLPEEIAAKDYLDNLSSGELQKVCFARIFYQDKDVWMLDEATSAMDDRAEKQIVNTLKIKQKEGKMIFAITHRQAFAEAASRRLMITEGTVAESMSES